MKKEEDAKSRLQLLSEQLATYPESSIDAEYEKVINDIKEFDNLEKEKRKERLPTYEWERMTPAERIEHKKKFSLINTQLDVIRTKYDGSPRCSDVYQYVKLRRFLLELQKIITKVFIDGSIICYGNNCNIEKDDMFLIEKFKLNFESFCTFLSDLGFVVDRDIVEVETSDDDLMHVYKHNEVRSITVKLR